LTEHSLRFVVALARDAVMSTSYKPALLKALVREVEGAEPLTLFRLGERFVRLYWTQTVVYRLRQAKTLHAEPQIVQDIRAAATEAGVRTYEALPDSVRLRLVRKTAKLLTVNVLKAFHTSAPDGMAPLFTWNAPDDVVRIMPSAATFLVAERAALDSVANLWWARYLEGVNRLAPAIIAKVEGTAARRASLRPYLRILHEVDPAECFYCAVPLDDSRTHVDHVIPWTFLYADELWDLVLACDTCNLAKSDVLPVRSYLDKLAMLNVQRAHVRLGKSNASPLIAAEELVRTYEAALSVEWPAGWAPGTSSASLR
jgi:hypothetical protein